MTEAHTGTAEAPTGTTGRADPIGLTAPAEAAVPQPHVLREYALLADGERGVLVGPRGELAWMCFPRWDSPAVFSALLGGRGHYSVTPTGRFVWGGSYDPGTLVWNSRWVTDGGVVECREALAHPGDPDRAVVLRRIRCLDGEAELTVRLAPAADFGARPMTDLRRDSASGDWTARLGHVRLRWAGAGDAGPRPGGTGGEELGTTVRLRAGQSHDLVLELATRPSAPTRLDPDELWRRTEDAWTRTVPDLDTSIAPDDARHAYAVLRGLTSGSSGMVAAATLGLPERAEEGRNYDYRYAWLRDQCYVGQAAAVNEAFPLLDDAVRFVAERVLDDGPGLAPVYTADGSPVPDEQRIALPGYPGGAAVVGNHAHRQFQLDTFGEALLLFATATGHGRLDSEGFDAAATAADAIAGRWQEPDAGVWELDDRRWAHSRLTCVAGLRAMSAHTRAACRWRDLADRIAASLDDCVHPTGRWQRAPQDPRVDGALLLPAIRGAVPAADPRSRATLRAVLSDLTDDGYVHRYRHDPPAAGPDAGGDPHPVEGAFLDCGFWAAMAEHQQGHAVSAARLFERNRAACGPPGLFTEEYDGTQRQLRGNLPQAFVHAGMLEASQRLARPVGDARA